MQAATEKIRDVPAGAECHVAQFGYDEAQTQTRSTGRVRGEALRYMRHRKPRLQRGYERGQESGKQCKAVPTLRKQTDSVHTEPACFMLVGALPQSPQNTESVFWKRWKVPAATRFCKSLNGYQRPYFSVSLSAVRESSPRIRSTFALAVCRDRISSLAFW